MSWGIVKKSTGDYSGLLEPPPNGQGSSTVNALFSIERLFFKVKRYMGFSLVFKRFSFLEKTLQTYIVPTMSFLLSNGLL